MSNQVTGAARYRIDRTEVRATIRQGGEIRILLSPRTVGSTSGFNGTLTLLPGEFVAAQRHPYSDKFIYLISGKLELTVDGEPVPLLPGQALFVPRDTAHRFVNHGPEVAQAVFSVAPLAPSPELGHVDLEPVPHPAEPLPHVGDKAATPDAGVR
ncbi:cupin domain-containing protein [Nocardia sp. NPDC056000]|uniref:cupin domain-containing protein n=1 Tax=Nocardia sp. NPDC056000 TaxID=3345674 RepID=UPI0035E0E46C